MLLIDGWHGVHSDAIETYYLWLSSIILVFLKEQPSETSLPHLENLCLRHFFFQIRPARPSAKWVFKNIFDLVVHNFLSFIPQTLFIKNDEEVSYLLPRIIKWPRLSGLQRILKLCLGTGWRSKCVSGTPSWPVGLFQRHFHTHVWSIWFLSFTFLPLGGIQIAWTTVIPPTEFKKSLQPSICLEF